MIQIFESQPLPFNRSEAQRYALARPGYSSDRLDQLAPEAFKHVHGRVCYDIFPVQSAGDSMMDLGFCTAASRSLCTLLHNSTRCVLFAATIGLDFDRYASRISRISQTDGWLMHAIGTERIESLCDAFEAYLRQGGFHLTPRFSPGYGDVPLSLQNDIFRVLDCPRKIGLTLNESLLMSPSKSVTAILGITDSELFPAPACVSCSMTDCVYRSSSHETE